MTTKPFLSLEPGDVLTKFSDFTGITVIEPAFICYDPRFNRLVTITKDSMARL